MDSWQEDRLTQIMAQLQQELAKEEEALEKIQETKDARPLSIAIARANTMMETILLNFLKFSIAIDLP
jgi:hypothetical protein